jgi:hypothetical protein
VEQNSLNAYYPVNGDKGVASSVGYQFLTNPDFTQNAPAGVLSVIACLEQLTFA